MRLVALTGGIGSGKSSVSDRLMALGAVVIDSDLLVRGLQEPGQPVFEAMVARWGSRIVAADGTLDRPAVAQIVFGDKAELEAINEIVHPAVRRATRDRIEAEVSGDKVVILDIPLLAETKNTHGAPAVIVVDCPVDIAIERLVEHRGFERDDAEARVATQASRDERIVFATFVVDNSGTEELLDAEVARCWTWLSEMEATIWPPRKVDDGSAKEAAAKIAE
jgi:dephospho-CoA kinase